MLAAFAGSCSWTSNQLDAASVLTEWHDGSPPLRMDIRSRLAASRNSPTCRNVTILRGEGQLDAESTPEQRERLKSALPLVWVHVPKSGTSFANALLHHVGICPKWPSCAMLLPGEKDAQFLKDWDLGELCEDGFAEDYRPPGHRSAGAALTLHGAEHGAMFLRQPEQRMLAAHTDGWPEASMSRDVPLTTYARGTAGCTVKMLTRRGTTGSERAQESYCAFDGDPPSTKEVETAISRLYKFAFIGLAEEWDASICLFHAQFGGRCHDFESAEVLEDAPPASAMPNASSVPVDKYDGELYAAAQEIFQSRLEEYGIVPGQQCEYCPSPKDLLNQPGCQRERNTDVNDWYPDRKAHETDCAYMCTDPGKAASPLHSCVASDFSTNENGRCDLYLCGEGAKQQIHMRGPPAVPGYAGSTGAVRAAAAAALAKAGATKAEATNADADLVDLDAAADASADVASLQQKTSPATEVAMSQSTSQQASQSTAEDKVAAYRVLLGRAEASDASASNALAAQKVSAYRVATEKEDVTSSDAGNEEAFSQAFSRAFAADKA